MATDTGTTGTTKKPRHETQRRSRSAAAGRLLGAFAVATYCVGLFAFGGVHPPVRAVLHGALAVGLLGAAAWLTDRALAKSGRALRWALASLLVLAAVGSGFVPLPLPLRWVLAPHDLREGLLAFSSVDPDGTLAAAANALLPLGFGLLVAATTPHVPSTGKVVERVTMGILAATLLTGIAHEVTRQRSLFGMYPSGLRAWFWAPFIDANQFATLVVALLPGALWVATDASRDGVERVGHGLLAAVACGTVAAVGSVGPLGLAGVALLWVGWRRGRVPWPVAVTVLGIGVVAVLILGRGTDGLLHGRAAIWGAGARAWLGHWFLGTGAGTFALAVEPYRPDHDFVTWTFAHNDWLQALVETGLVGAALLAAAAWLFRPGPSEDPARSAPLDAGVALLLAEAAVEFPSQVPGLTLLGAGLLAYRTAALSEGRTTAPVRIRTALLAFAVLEIGAAGWCVRDRQVERAHATLATQPQDRAALRTLERLAWWTPEYAASSVLATALGVSDGAAAPAARALADDHPQSPVAQRVAAEVLIREDPERALVAADRALVLAPADWRNWVARARVLSRGRDATPDDTLAAATAWRDAIVAEAPSNLLAEAWKVLPIGIWWVDAFADAPPVRQAALGEFLLGAGELEAGLLAHEQALAAGEVGWHPGYARALLESGRLEEAEDYLVATLAEDPDAVPVQVTLARLREAQGDWEAAAEIRLRLARADLRQGREAVLAVEHARGVEAALQVARRLQIDAAVPSTELRIEEARLERDAGRPERCMELLAAPLDPRRSRGVDTLLKSCRAAVASSGRQE